MKRIFNLIGAAALFAAAAGSGRATIISGAGESSGLLGRSYLGATFDYVDTHAKSLRGEKGSTVFFNRPVAENVDASFQYSYAYARMRPRGKVKEHELFADSTYVFKRAGAQPYLRGGIGRSMNYVPGPNRHEWLYRTEAGVEMPLGRSASLAPYVRYTDGFRRRTADTFEGGVLTQAALSENVNLIARAARVDTRNNAFSVGLTLPFGR